MNTIVYIDGQNFLYKIAERLISANLISSKQDITSIDVPSLLAPLFPNQKLEIRYYGVRRISKGATPSAEIADKAQQFSDNLRRLKNYLAKNGVQYIAKGSLKVRTSEPCKRCGYIDSHFQEKGVDVGLAVDMVRDATVRTTKHIVIISSDTDLLPALQIVKSEKVKISYVSFSGQPTISLVKIADQHLVLSDKAVCEAYIGSLN